MQNEKHQDRYMGGWMNRWMDRCHLQNKKKKKVEIKKDRNIEGLLQTFSAVLC